MPTRRALLAAAAAAPVIASSRAAADTSPTVESDLIVAEVSGVTLRADVYLPPARVAPRPAVVLVPGSLWYNVDRRNMGQPGRGLAAAGYVGIAVETRGRPDPTSLSPGGFSWPAQLDDVQRAVRWIRANAARWGIDPARIGAYGETTGGHLAAMLGLRDTRDDDTDPALAGISSRVACVVDLGGPVDFSLLHAEVRHEAFVDAFLGGSPEAAADAYRDASPLSWVDDTAGPFLIVQGGRDVYVEPPQGRRLASALDEAGIELVYAALPLASQAAVTNWEFVDSFALPFLGRHLKPDE